MGTGRVGWGPARPGQVESAASSCSLTNGTGYTFSSYAQRCRRARALAHSGPAHVGFPCICLPRAGAAFVHATPSLQLANALATFVFSLLNVFCVSCCLRSYIRCRVLVTGGLHPLAGLRLRPELRPEEPVA